MYTRKAYGKINLSLEVNCKRNDGYHEIDTIMNRIDLFDLISFKEISEDKLILNSNDKNFPTDENNLIYKAWDILKKHKRKNFGMEIFVNKNLPIAAGLAGGTSDGCEVMKGLNEIWNLGFSNSELMELAKPLGADSSFFFYEGLVRARGIGDKITPLGKLKEYPLLLINIGKPISSKEVYDKINTYSNGVVSNLVENIDDENYLFQNAFNSMEEVSFKIFPELEEVKSILKDHHSELSLMSGSGPTVFGIFKDDKLRDIVYDSLFGKYELVLKSKTI